MPSNVIAITEIGAIARGALARATNGSVMGVTTHGLFLLLNSGRVVFFSSEGYRGPLTLNHGGDSSLFRLVNNGQPANVLPDQIIFPGAELVIHTGQAVSWEAPTPPREALGREQRYTQLTRVARHLLGIKQTSILSELLPVLLGLEKEPSADENPALSILCDVQNSLEGRRMKTIVDGLGALLGMGNGLTPSGDDVAIGFLLTMARWGKLLASDLNVEALRQEILPQAHRKTTTLSANLIDCALQGQANERLLLAMDGIFCGNVDPSACSAYLAGWGNTSGLDALVGIALAVGI